jgi:tetratricopeptide (TPR) repeat protein
MRSLSVSRAVTLLERALALAPDRRSAADAECALGDAYASDAKADDAWAHYLRAREVYRETGGAPAALYRGMLDIRTKANAFHTRPTEELIAELLDEAEAQARAAADRSALARVQMHRSLRLNDLDDLELLREADRMAAESGDPVVRSESLGWLIAALLDRCDIDAVMPLFAERERLRQEAPAGGLASLEAVEPLVTAALLRGDLAEARSQAERARTIGAPMGPHLRTHALMPLSTVETAAGTWERVRAVGQEVREIMATSPGTPFCLLAGVSLANAAIAEALAHHTDDARALVRLAEGIQVSPAIARLTAVARALLAEPRRGPETGGWWWFVEVYTALAQPTGELASRLQERAAHGARALGALAEAVAAASRSEVGEAQRGHAALRSLGLLGWSEVLERTRGATASAPAPAGTTSGSTDDRR